MRVLAQQMIPPSTPEYRGIRMDVEITEYDEGTVTNVYDIEPHLRDGLHFIYFYTKGHKGGSQGIKNMLTYFQNSDSKNAVDEATREIDSYVRKVKGLPEVEGGYMTLGDWADNLAAEMRKEIREEVREEVRKKSGKKQEKKLQRKI